jgi:hypothetical protein
VENSLPIGNEIVGDDAAVTSPPRASEHMIGAALLASLVEQMLNGRPKRFGKSIIGVVAKALVGPEPVNVLG